jgi:hypothetical protein
MSLLIVVTLQSSTLTILHVYTVGKMVKLMLASIVLLLSLIITVIIFSMIISNDDNTRILVALTLVIIFGMSVWVAIPSSNGSKTLNETNDGE